MLSSLSSSKKGFSILLALGSIGVLMVIVVGMIEIFLTEMKLSRYQYDSILAGIQAEGAFEYAMLKVANHRDGFSDGMNSESKDQTLFRGSTPRSEKNTVSYQIEANTGNYTHILDPNEYLILPLFVGNDTLIDSPNPSKIPNQSQRSDNASDITLNISPNTGNNSLVSWSIVGFENDKNVSISGKDDITSATKGVSRFFMEDCFDSEGGKIACNDASVYERIPYFYDKVGTLEEFLNGNGEFSTIPNFRVRDPYIMIFNGDDIPHTMTLRSGEGRFALPTMTVTTDAKKGNALHTIRYSTNKSKFYDAIKYSVYNIASEDSW